MKEGTDHTGISSDSALGLSVRHGLPRGIASGLQQATGEHGTSSPQTVAQPRDWDSRFVEMRSDPEHWSVNGDR
jgi:hypothetical protein